MYCLRFVHRQALSLREPQFLHSVRFLEKMENGTHEAAPSPRRFGKWVCPSCILSVCSTASFCVLETIWQLVDFVGRLFVEVTKSATFRLLHVLQRIYQTPYSLDPSSENQAAIVDTGSSSEDIFPLRYESTAWEMLLSRQAKFQLYNIILALQTPWRSIVTRRQGSLICSIISRAEFKPAHTARRLLRDISEARSFIKLTEVPWQCTLVDEDKNEDSELNLCPIRIHAEIRRPSPLV